MSDLLSDVLRRTALRGTVYFKADFAAPWAMAIGRRQVAAFHVLVRGRCFVRDDDGLVELQPGDIVVYPHGDPHALLSEPDAHPVPAEDLLATNPESGMALGGRGDISTLICGHFERDTRLEHPLFATLPGRIHLPARGDGDASWLATATELAVLESGSRRAGSAAVTDRLAEVLLIQVLRLWAERLERPAGFLSALSDAGLSRALALLHQHPENTWTVEQLARAARMSRSHFAARFRESVGVTPIAYLAEWRMLLARRLLEEGTDSVARVAEQVGYSSEWAFSKAFKRAWGENPGAVRRRSARSG
ncbi:MAG: AraC family transcriptional regulator [Acidobacteriota bacterium]